MEITSIKAVGNKTVTCTITKSVEYDVNYADGYNIVMGRKTYDALDIILTVDEKCVARSHDKPETLSSWRKSKSTDELMAKGAYARLGDTYISKSTYDMVMDAYVDAGNQMTTDDEYVVVKAQEVAKEARKEAAYQADRELAKDMLKKGCCPKCGTWCYGDCTAR